MIARLRRSLEWLYAAPSSPLTPRQGRALAATDTWFIVVVTVVLWALVVLVLVGFVAHLAE